MSFKFLLKLFLLFSKCFWKYISGNFFFKKVNFFSSNPLEIKINAFFFYINSFFHTIKINLLISIILYQNEIYRNYFDH